MRERQRRRINRFAVVWVGVIACWAAFYATRIVHQLPATALREIFVGLAVATAAVGVAHAHARAIRREHARTRKAIADSMGALPPWLSAVVAAKIQEALAPRGRLVRSTTYIPDRDFAPHKMATMRDLTADHTGDIQDYLDRT